MKIKGNKNESFHLRASLSPDFNYVICGSEDGEVYLWSQIESNIVSLSTQQSTLKILPVKVSNKKKDQINHLEHFTAFEKVPVSAATFAPKPVLK